MAESRAERVRLLLRRLDEDRQVNEDEARLLEQVAQMVERLDAAPHEFAVVSVCSRGVPKLDVTWHGYLAQVDPVKGREIGWMLLEAASIAEAEAMVIRFALERIGVTEGQAGSLLRDMREYRKAYENQGSLVGRDPKSTM